MDDLVWLECGELFTTRDTGLATALLCDGYELKTATSEGFTFVFSEEEMKATVEDYKKGRWIGSGKEFYTLAYLMRMLAECNSKNGK